MSKEKSTAVCSPLEDSAIVLPDLSYIAEGLRCYAVPIEDVAFFAENPRKHGEKDLETTKASLRRFGQVELLVVNQRETPPVVLNGNGRLRGALELGWTYIAVHFVDLDRRTANALSVVLNRTAELAHWDEAALNRLLAETPAAGADPRLDEMLAELRSAVRDPLSAVRGIGGERIAESGWRIADDGAETELEGDFEEDDLDLLFKSPYPWFGGKSRVAGIVWKRFGDLKGFIEPFFGSGAVFLNRPQPFDGVETINDLDALVSNFWRAVQAAPDDLAKWCDWPALENDLTARHAWLVGKKDALTAKLEGDPDYFDAKIAGWWCWGMALWIGGKFCSGKGPWQIVEAEDGSRQLVHLGNEGRGVQRRRVHLSDEGRGVQRQRVHLGDEGKPGCGERGLLAWMQALSERLRRVRVCCGDWKRVCGGNSGDALHHFFVSGEPCGVFLDPPYAALAGRDESVYRCEDLQVAHAVRDWAIGHGDDPRLRIALAGYEGEHDMPASWECVKWKAHGGMGALANGDSRGKENRFRERLWFSPHCLRS
jgi:hypothetical protein